VRGLFPLVTLLGFVVFGQLAGIAAGGDVAFAEAQGELGVGGSLPEAPVSGAPTVLAQESAGVLWMQTVIYLLAATAVLAGYVLAARRWPWLRRHRRKS
jgi:pyruvate/2-oxoacid:ferredoxin oxidoreductase alpha subunit